jgi:hypothetical protein
VHEVERDYADRLRQFVQEGGPEKVFNQAVCAGLDVIQGTSPVDAAASVVAGMTVPQRIQVRAAIDSISDALANGDVTAAFLSTICAI